MKNIKIFLSILSLVIVLPGSKVFADSDNKYPVSAIPADIKSNAKAVIREKKVVFELKSISDARVSISYAITILNKSALKNSYFFQYYDKFNKIKNIKGTIYDETGKLVKRIKDEDIDDYSANTGSSLFVDTRIIYIDPEYRKYPFTVEYSFEIKHNGLLHYPNWIVYPDYDIAVEKSSFTVKIYENMKFRYYERNLESKYEHKTIDDFQQYIWEVNNMTAIEYEPYSPPLLELSPAVFLAPADFSIDGYAGNFESWNNFGKWINTLNEGLTELPEETRKKIKSIIHHTDNDYEKCKLLYEYLQDNTRYVSVQIGIGGWKPIDAEKVDRLGYGDCKALTNYMKALLEVAGIESYYTLVRAGKNISSIISDFPSNQFNHAILCMPIDNDTIWLECTNQRIPFGYIGASTDDRNVVIVNSEGGNLAKTKIYSHNDNQQNSNIDVQIDNYGNAISYTSTDYKGIFYDKQLYISLSDEHNQKQMIRNNLHIPNLELRNFSFTETREIVPSMRVDVEIITDGYGTSFGNRMIINLNFLNKLQEIPNRKDERVSDIVIRRSYIQTDTITYHLPTFYIIEKTSGNHHIETEFGDFVTSITSDGSKLTYTRYLKMNKGKYPPEAFDRFMDFIDEIKNADKDKAIIVKNEAAK